MKKSFSTSLKLIKNFRKNSIFFKYLKKTMLIITLPFLIIGLFSYCIYDNSISKEIKNTVAQETSKAANTTDNILTKSDECFSLIYTNENVNTFLTNPNLTKYGLNTYNNTKKINQLLKNFISSSPYIDSIYIYSSKNEYVLSSKNSNNFKDFSDKVWYDKYQKDNNPNFICFSPKNQNKLNDDFICISYGIYSNSNLIGIVVLNINVNYLKDMFISPNTKYTTFYILNDNKVPIYCSNWENLESDNKYFSQITENQSLFKTKQNICAYQKISAHNVTMVSLTSNELLSEKTKTLINIGIVIAILIIILPFILAFYISINFYKSIAELTFQFQNINESERRDNVNELSYINENIMNLIKNNESIETQLAQKVISLRKSQSIALQAQINPHFLFNTLNLVNVIIMNILKKENMAEKVISLLSDIVYYTFKTKHYIVYVSEEIEYIKKYIEIEKIKHKDNFDFILTVDKEILSLKTIKLILQPIVENAFEHGINLLLDERGQLVINAYCENDFLIFEIKNNGPYLTPKKLEEMNDLLKADEISQNTHIGLSNVNQRIKLIYGENCGVQISTSQNEVTVTLKLGIMNQ